MRPLLTAVILSATVLSVGGFLQFSSVGRFVGEPQTCLLAASGLCLFGIVAGWRRCDTKSVD